MNALNKMHRISSIVLNIKVLDYDNLHNRNNGCNTFFITRYKKDFFSQATTCTLELLYSWNKYQLRIIDKPRCQAISINLNY